MVTGPFFYETTEAANARIEEENAAGNSMKHWHTVEGGIDVYFEPSPPTPVLDPRLGEVLAALRRYHRDVPIATPEIGVLKDLIEYLGILKGS